MKIGAIVQARLGSVRLPNKVMKTIDGTPMIGLLLSRLSKSEELDQIIVATSIDEKNAPLAGYVRELGYACERGSEDNVLDRFVQTAKAHELDVVVRITGDCPLVDSELVDACIRHFKDSGADYCSNTNPPTYPDGLDIEVVTAAALEKALELTDKAFDLEHVTPFVRESGDFSLTSTQHEQDFSALRWTVDEASDFEVVQNVFEHFSPDTHFSWEQVLNLQQSAPELFEANQTMKRNEGATLGKGQKLWKRAKKVIPGGNMLLSKRAEMFLPDLWPAYFSKAKGCKVWDLDGNEYIDVSIMGIGTNTLGYGHPEVDEAVRQTVDAGNMSTFNCPEEVYLAEKLVELHPWADMVRLARSGGEANAIAIRIARAASGRDKVAICGYHGWHDWYLSANLAQDKNLDGHLLPGLEPRGVPRELAGSVLPFNYNDFEALETLVANNDIGVIKMEVTRNEEPKDGYLDKVRKLATDNNIVLLFDECTSGFRETFGGLHKKYGVEPDMAVFGKALGNGYGITAVIGSREIMEAAQSTFISSTFWTERIGPSAALKSLEVMERISSWDIITQTGKKIQQGWQSLADKHGISITQAGLPSMATYGFAGPNSLEYKTLVTQEMLGRGYLASNVTYVCIDHTPEVLEGYFDALNSAFALVKECQEGREVMSLLKGPVCHGGFKRLN